MQKIINRISSSYFTHSAPNHLIVIQHGWLAPWIRATPLGKGLTEMASQQHVLNNNNRYLIHIIRSNSDDYLFGCIKTQDGINKGGQRTCNEIKAILDKHQTINKLSLIGQSLGGLYIRYALKQLYDTQNRAFYNDIEPRNFITLGSPHLGADDWMRAKKASLFASAKYAAKLGLLPKTVTQLLRLDEELLLNELANNNEYLLPLSLFDNRLIYANAINDNRVSCSSGLLLPSFDYAEEEQLIQDLFIKHINYSTKEKISIVRPIVRGNKNECDVAIDDISMVLNERKKDGENEENENNEWYDKMSNSMEWKRFVVAMNSNFIDKHMAHGLLANPIPFYSSCQPVLDHLNKHFEW